MIKSSPNQSMLERLLKESLDSGIVALIAEKKNMDIRNAMDIYYKSKLAGQVDRGEYGMQYLDAAYLVDDLIENEPDLFK
jgi:hypothetical protein